MTIVVAVAAPDGLILAADSRTTFTDGQRHRIASDNTQKVYPIRDCIAVATYGQNGIGQRTIAGLMDEFVSLLPNDQPLQGAALAQALGDFFDSRYRAETAPEEVQMWEASPGFPLGFLVAGYDDDGIGRIREVSIPGPLVQDDPGGVAVNTAVRGVSWRGQTDVIRRLVFGFDEDAFRAGGNDIPADLVEPIGKLAYQVLFPITMQDAVDFAAFLIRTTIDMQRFSDGTGVSPGDLPGCGGPVRMLAVTRDALQWVAEPTLMEPNRAGVAEGGFVSR